ncbi:uncharacterized protein DNG_08201 [Cephalotrichum gorgonifer]|uniref:Mtf2-like C-terminal domain-containing protein n=1 Tax=Cephalotrichum gorgonifer TaxID=2041049 RepID=A0AAE8N4P5_9PEZI|nr:uncharacterized protein DNG_08201 [Cephalotrichum gorgonifer]
MSSTLLPFLYQTRTLQRAIRPRTTLQLVRGLRVSAHRQVPRNSSKNDDSVPFEFAPDQGNIAATRTKRSSTSTITESEQRVFDEIFGDISKRRKQFGGPMPDAEISPSSREQFPDDLSPEDVQELNRERILTMYPPALRRAAKIAMGLQEDGGDKAEQQLAESQSPATTSPEPEITEKARKQEEAKAAKRAALKALHNEEKARVQALMQECTSDIALWQVLEGHVFSMVPRLGIGNAKTAALKNKAKKAQPAPGAALSMDRYGPLYSVHLLSALRHLDRGFATPSRLALNVLPRILELGMASYVLGVSTRFYNELMSIYWYRYGDSESVMRLLKEMERSGLSGDGQTLKIVDAVAGTIEGLAETGKNGAFAGVLSTMQEFDSVVLSRLTKRRKWVLDSMQEQSSNLPY